MSAPPDASAAGLAAARRPMHDALFHYWTEFDALALLAGFHCRDQQPEPGLIRPHSREIEGRLMGHFPSRGWRLEMERPAIAPSLQGRPRIRVDSVQLWANPAEVLS